MRSYRLVSIVVFAMLALAYVGKLVSSVYSFAASMFKNTVDVFLEACYTIPIQAKEKFGLGKANTIGRTWEPKEATNNHRGNKDISFGVHIHSNSLRM